MHLRIPALLTAHPNPSVAGLLCIHASGAWSFAGGDDESDDAWPVVAAFEV